MILDFVIKNAVPIIESRIKEVINRTAGEYQLNVSDVFVMLKHNLEIYAFGKGKRLKNIPFNDIGGGVYDVAGKFIQKVFARDALIYGVQEQFVNYVFKILPNSQLGVCPNISGDYKEWTTLTKIMFPNG